MNKPDFSHMRDAAAIQFMVLDMLGTILTLSETPARMGVYLTQQIRELVGARVVVLLQYLGGPEDSAHRIVSIQPERYIKSDSVRSLGELVPSMRRKEEGVLWTQEAAPAEVAQTLRQMNIASAIVVPLMVSSEQVGALLALDLLEMDRNQDVLRSLEMLSSVIGLVLRNAFYYESLEDEVRIRTQELTASEQHFRTLTKVAPVGIFHLDHAGHLVFANDRWRQITGIHWLEGPPGEFIHLIHPDDKDSAGMAWQEAFHGGREFRAEFRLVRKDESIVHVIAQAVGEFDDEGVQTGIIGTLTDISERKQAEEERLLLESQFTQAQKMESIGRLAGGVAHDINNMLAVMIGHLELMKRTLPPEEHSRRHVEQMEKAAGRTREIVSQLLAFSRKQVIQPVLFNINARIEETRRAIAPLLGEDIDFRFHPDPALWHIRADPSQLDQVLLNLTVNARDAMPEGGCLTVETRNVSLDEAYCRENLESAPGRYVQLTVSDEGVGIPPDILAQVFEPFFTTKGEGRGTGLGLSTVFGIVKQNGGFVNVYSEPGQGSAFKVYLPAVLEVEEPAVASAADAEQLAQGTILMVEDDPLLLNVIPMLIESLGYTVIASSSPDAALQICQDPGVTIDLLLTDVVMPSMSGRELMDRMLQVRPHLRVLFMSGYTSNVIALKGVLDGGTHFIQKPFTLADLRQKITTVLNARAQG